MERQPSRPYVETDPAPNGAVARAQNDQAETPPSQHVWVYRRHWRVTRCQVHAVIGVDWHTWTAVAACGLRLAPEEIADVPDGGCMPCEFCIARTPTPCESTA